MVYKILVTIIGTIFIISAAAALIIYIVERTNYKKIKEEDDNKKKLSIITGASSGLGRDFAKFISKNKDYEVDEIILIARREDRLEKLKNTLPIDSTSYPMDMTDEEEMEEFKKYLENKVDEENLEIKYLINAAGSGIRGESLDFGSSREIETIKINCEAQVNMTHIVANLMNAGSSILQIASVAAFNPMEHLNMYAASKAFIYTYARGLRGELMKRGINVTTVCPYFIEDTEFIDKAEMDRKKLFLPLKSKHVVKKSMADMNRNFALSTPGFVATADRILGGLVPDEVLLYIMRKFV
ncbi:SDR family NAD(P)-dependent oxidoreductase [Peptoniphilus sp.]|uniref:SDR family NAD(P)-dependent oxidoreductase n=1 Tax=Peptoniphilus sp. TaxID=1971214 RepID=UPI003D90DC9A